MRILLDECLPKDFKYELAGHQAATVGDMDWLGIKNGQLLTLAEEQFDIFLTADRGIEYQQNLRNRQITLIILVAPKTSVETLRPLTPLLLEALQTVAPGQIVHVSEHEYWSTPA